MAPSEYGARASHSSRVQAMFLSSLAVAADPERGLVIAGSTRGALDGRPHGNLDAYALRFVEPSKQ